MKGDRKPMKKLMSIMAAGVLTVAMTVCAFAASSPSASTVTPAATTTTTVEVIPAATVAAAASETKTVEEYVNNSIASTPGIETKTVVAQGGKTIINGVPTNLTFALQKVDKATATYAKSLGNVLTVFNMKAPVKFKEALVPIYAKGVVAGQTITVYQLQNGVWVKVPATVRADHVDVALTMAGPIVFVLG